MEKIINQIWVGPYSLPDREKRFIEEIKIKHPDYEHKLWTEDLELPENISKVYEQFRKQKDYAHMADVLRIFIVNRFGGTYLDVDFKYEGGLQNLNLDDKDGFFCNHGGNDYTMPNGVFGLKKGTEIGKFLEESIGIDKGMWYGPSWLGDKVKEFLGLSRETPHQIVKEKLRKINIDYVMFPEFEKKCFRHHALYSWSPENKKNFENGNINYLK